MVQELDLFALAARVAEGRAAGGARNRRGDLGLGAARREVSCWRMRKQQTLPPPWGGKKREDHQAIGDSIMSTPEERTSAINAKTQFIERATW